MPGIITHYRGVTRPVIEIEIAPASTVWSKSGARPVQKIMALVDTGASHNVVTPAIASLLGVPPSGTIEHSVPGGIKRVQPLHICDLMFNGIRHYDHGPYQFTINGANVIEDHLDPGLDAILGWDALHAFDLHFSRDGTMTIHLP